MPIIQYYSGGRLRCLKMSSRRVLREERSRSSKSVSTLSKAFASTTITPFDRRSAGPIDFSLYGADGHSTLVSILEADDSAVIPTASIIVEGASKGKLKKIRSRYGLKIINEGLCGKVLLAVPEIGDEGVKRASMISKEAFESGDVDAALPNFVRIFKRIRLSDAGVTRSKFGIKPLWNHMNEGNPGIPGADVAARAAWLISKGRSEVRVAILDEGVDTDHPALKPTVVAEKDFVDGNRTSIPNGNDAHGTACAGVIFSRDEAVPGLASLCSLVAIRIAKGDVADAWIFDDFKTSDAIDWAWSHGEADVLSNSWGGGPMVDSISRAFERARIRGRKGKGCVVVVAAGNNDGGIQFPSSLPNVMAVGASNPWDERKSKSPISKDNETSWGSCYGKGLSLVAPGVSIATTDIHGAAGYGADDFITSFNGTSSATPHVAAAALIISLVPDIREELVRQILVESADNLSNNCKWDKFVGWGRLNIFAALRLALRK